MPIPSLSNLLGEADPSGKQIERILDEVALGLLEARLVIDERRWHRISDNDGLLMAFLTETFGPPKGSWDSERILGAPALQKVREINQRAHAWTTTSGAAKYRSSVVQAQGGDFCSVCGSRSDLAVDHIVPVSVGGSQDALSNMQLLCRTCNSGKSSLRDRLLPMAISLRTTRDVPAGLRFKHLLLGSVEIDGRTRGVCSCGTKADRAELRVEAQPEAAAANFLTLVTRCTACNVPEDS